MRLAAVGRVATAAAAAAAAGTAILAMIGPALAAESAGRDENDIRARLKAYAPVRLQPDLSGLGPGDRDALQKIVAAVASIDAIYWKQMGPQALEARAAFAGAKDPVDLLYRDFVAINYG